ncbi:uncharacterized protein LOC110880066 isoform X2 [Helianthus annuus]|uniref:uncharacterized protein LOC110880066 isoform X2 n=1 Tax=Helianthus annuus TaxID=4232 RepID=UPI000B902CD8|nr:uncharacterized protein LOC110880066 isoform X2 [Helianthus annuus]
MESKAMMRSSEVKLKVDCKRKFHAHEVLQLKKRLTHLEKEVNMMKEEMFRNRTERKALLDEVYRQLKLVHFSLLPENQTLGCKFYVEGGLSQVLYEDQNPSVFIREANSVEDPAPAQSIIPTTKNIP